MYAEDMRQNISLQAHQSHQRHECVDMAGPLFLRDGRKMWVMSVHLCGISCGSLGIGLVNVQ